MRGLQRTIAAGVMLAGLGVLVGVAIGSGGSTHLVAQRVPPVEVRTEVIRKTVNVYRRAKPHHVTGTGPGGGGGGIAVPSATALVGRTRTSGVSAASRAPVVSTRTSGAGGGSTSAPRTRSSGGSTSTPRTRSSGGGEGDGGGGGHDN